MLDALRTGGPFLWLLLIMSVVAVAFIIERGWALRSSMIRPEALSKALGVASAEDLRSLALAQPSPLARLVTLMLDHREWSKTDNAEAVQVLARQEVAQMERGLVILEIIVGIAPLLGLVGTIYAIIPIFADFGRAVTGDNALLAQGIAAALNKTLAGLMVAIPALVAWSYYNKRVELLAVELEGLCDGLLRRLYLGDLKAPVVANPASARKP